MLWLGYEIIRFLLYRIINVVAAVIHGVWQGFIYEVGISVLCYLYYTIKFVGNKILIGVKISTGE